MSSKPRNGYIDLLRFFAACVIMYFHFGNAPFLRLDGTWGSFPSGALFVEFFFMLSGYFAISSFHASGNQLCIGKYMLKKYIHFLPYTIIAVSFAYGWVLVFNTETLYDAVKTLTMAPFEAFLMRNTGINMAGYNGVLWYLSAMLITLPIILFVARRFPSLFKEYLVWVVPIFLYGCIVRKYGTLRTTQWLFSNLRAIAGLLLGCNIYYFLQFLKKVPFSAVGKTTLTIFEALLFVLIILFCTVRSFEKTYLDVFCVLLMYLFAIIALSGKSWTNKFQGRVLTYLGKLSLPIYCNQFNAISIMEKYFSNYDMKYQLLIYTILVFSSSVAVQFFVDYIVTPFVKKLEQKITLLSTRC